jgi:predicted nucleic acid-binding Zn ribbon protein
VNKGDKPETVGAILDRLLKGLEIDRRIDEGKALGLWPEAAGDKLAKKTRAVSVVRGRMTVECRSGAWANECRMLKPKLLEKLNKGLGREVIKDIVFRAGDF